MCNVQSLYKVLLFGERVKGKNSLDRFCFKFHRCTTANKQIDRCERGKRIGQSKGRDKKTMLSPAPPLLIRPSPHTRNRNKPVKCIVSKFFFHVTFEKTCKVFISHYCEPHIARLRLADVVVVGNLCG